MKDAEARALLVAVGSRDQAAFTALYRAFEGPVYRFVTSKLNDPHEAADILHEVFMEVWRSASRFEGRSAVKTWLFGIAYRKTMDRFRKSGRETVTDETPEVADESASALDMVATGQMAAHLRHCLDELSAPQRLAIELAFFEDRPYREIAEIADVPEGTVKTRVHHAKQLLKRCVSNRLGSAREALA